MYGHSQKLCSLTQLPEPQVGRSRCSRVIRIEGAVDSLSFLESAQELALLTEVHNLSELTQRVAAIEQSADPAK